MRRLRNVLRLSGRQRSALLEAGLFLTWARLAVWCLPFRWVARYLGEYRAETREKDEPVHLPALREVFWSIRVMSRNLPFGSTCLVQAMAGQWMLRRRRLPGTLYLGLARDRESGELLAHAWVRSGEKVLTGGSDLSRGYTVVGSFAEGEKS